MRSAYDRNLGDVRVKVGSERIAASPPNRRQIPPPGKSIVIACGISARVPLFRRPELALPPRHFVFFVFLNVCLLSRGRGDFFSKIIGTDTQTLLLTFSPLVLVRSFLSKFKLWTGKMLGTDTRTFVASKRTFLDRWATRIRRFVPDTPRYGRAPKNR